MFSVIFEMNPKKEKFNEYLKYAEEFKPLLGKVEGFIENERYLSLGDPGWILSLSTWRDEKSVIRWRTNEVHHHAQEKGRDEIFNDYHLRVGEITNDSSVYGALTQRRFDETEAGKAKLASIIEFTIVPGEEIDVKRWVDYLNSMNETDHAIFEGITDKNKFAVVVFWSDTAKGNAWEPSMEKCIADIRVRLVRIIRDYSMRDRREAPQYYPTK